MKRLYLFIVTAALSMPIVYAQSIFRGKTVRLDDINYFNKVTNLNRVKIVSQDGPTEYIKKVVNKMDDKTYDLFIKYSASS